VEEEEGDLRRRGREPLKTTIVSLSEDTIRFLIEGVDTAFTNALRRAMVAEVPTMTIEDIFYFDNSSLVSDEVLANRLGFTPLKTDLDNYVLPMIQ
jgi:DNA-directed RNA polymerase subunit D